MASCYVLHSAAGVHGKGWYSVVELIDAAGWPQYSQWGREPTTKRRALAQSAESARMIAARAGTEIITRKRYDQMLPGGEFQR